jgi:tetratricopeptide (TPR) repeat protein
MLFGSVGCNGSKPGADRPTSALSQRAGADRKAATSEGIPPDRLDAILREHYRGVGFIERYDYEKAAEAFRKVHELAPQWIPGSINLAIAFKDQRVEEYTPSGHSARDEALYLLDDVLARDPANLHAHYCRGLILQASGDSGLIAKARAEFRVVVESDPKDAHAWYWLGTTLDMPPSAAVGRDPNVTPSPEELDEQIAAFRKAIECNPNLAAPYYKLAMFSRLKGDPGSIRKYLDLWKKLEGDRGFGRPGEDINHKYGEAGRYAKVINPLERPSAPSDPIRPPRFDLPAPLKVQLAEGERWVASSDFKGRLAVIGRARARFGAPVAAFDADSDGRTDLFLLAAVVGPRGVRDALLLNRGEGSFEDGTRRLGLPVDRASLGAAAGDFDADGRVDLFLTGLGDNRLYRNEGSVDFKDVTNHAGIADPRSLSLSARWLDLDQDGDLDLYIVNYTDLAHLDDAFTGRIPPGLPNAAFRNDGKPRPVPGLPSSEWHRRPSRGIRSGHHRA